MVTAKVKQDLAELTNHLREDISKMNDPPAKAFFEASAELLIGLEKPFLILKKRLKSLARIVF